MCKGSPLIALRKASVLCISEALQESRWREEKTTKTWVELLVEDDEKCWGGIIHILKIKILRQSFIFNLAVLSSVFIKF